VATPQTPSWQHTPGSEDRPAPPKVLYSAQPRLEDVLVRARDAGARVNLKATRDGWLLFHAQRRKGRHPLGRSRWRAAPPGDWHRLPQPLDELLDVLEAEAVA